MAITSFSGEHEFLSNFYIEEDGKSLEHWFQADKTTCLNDREKILAADTPGQAKRLGRKTLLRLDWMHIRVERMRILLSQKFSDPDLSEQLLATLDEELIEGNTWGDRFWGACWENQGVAGPSWNGENWLGKLLMELRAKQRAATGRYDDVHVSVCMDCRVNAEIVHRNDHRCLRCGLHWNPETTRTWRLLPRS